MGQLAGTRIGWENEHLATFLLSRISFVAHPMTVADDVGSDFFCTLFELRSQNGSEQLFPRNSFAIQVKSADAAFQATNKIEYLEKLELPFFVGVVDRNQLRLRIFSGEYVPILFSEKGKPHELQLCPVPATEVAALGYFEIKNEGSVRLRLPLVVEIYAQDRRDDILMKARKLGELCSRMHGNISARASKEYIFRLSQPDKALIMAGPDSVQTFRHNFYFRLAEAFYNLEWIYNNQRDKFGTEEFRVYEKCYLDLSSIDTAIPPLLKGVYDRLKEQLAKVGQKPA